MEGGPMVRVRSNQGAVAARGGGVSAASHWRETGGERSRGRSREDRITSNRKAAKKGPQRRKQLQDRSV